jgi:hypothetical protein
LPITTPGRAEKIVMRAFLAGLNQNARNSFSASLWYSRTLMSSASMPAKITVAAYQRLASCG